MYSKKVKEFTKVSSDIKKEIKKFSKEEINFITQMVMDELEELKDSKDIYEQVDALIDIVYYIINFACRSAVDLDPIFNIVHSANMQKIVNGKVIKREDGKILKPQGWQDPKPKIIAEIQRQQKCLLES